MNIKLDEKIEKVKDMSIEELCKKFNCKPEEICVGDYNAKNTNDTVCPYKVILGFANFEGSNVKSLGDLEVVYGKKLIDKNSPIKTIHHNPIYLGITIKNSKIRCLGNLKKVYGSIDLNYNIKSLGNLKFLGSNLYLVNSNVEDLGELEIIDGVLNLEDDVTKCKLTSLGKLKKLRRLYINSNCLKDLGDLEEVREISIPKNKYLQVRNLITSNLSNTGTKYIRKELKVD